MISTKSTSQPATRLIRKKEVCYLTGLSESSIYDYIHNGLFPDKVSLGCRSVAWVEAEVLEWVHERINNRCGDDVL